MRIVEVHRGARVAARRQRRHPRAVRRAQRRPQAHGELEMPDVVGRQLRFEPARVAGERGRHDARVVHQHVQGTPRRREARGERIDRRGVEEIERVDLDACDAGDGGARRVAGRPRADDHRRPGPASARVVSRPSPA
ncbi:MAG TPA: hypothetical protein VKE22_12290 [Haliangiales bacterium]|nr:hypothetical protein [Haliangiales bacterium]